MPSTTSRTSPEQFQRRVVRHALLATQCVFFATLLWCVILDHGPQAQNDGISYYGVHARTLPIIATGFVCSMLGLWWSAVSLRALHAPWLIWGGLRAVALSLPLLLLTPYTGGPFLNWAHMSIGVAGALVQLAIAIALLWRDRSPVVAGAFLLQLAGGLVAAASLPDWHFTYLLTGESVYQLGFSACLVLWTYER